MTSLNENRTENAKTEKVSRFRDVSSQVLASLPGFFLQLTIGMCLNYAAVIIPDLLDAEGELSLTKAQTSWFGGLLFLTQPIGGVLCGPICDYFGRKRALIIVNLPQIIGWTLFYYSYDVSSLFIANSMLGIGYGVMEASSITYIAEISNPRLRGILIIIAMMSASFGCFFISALGTCFHWKTTAIIVVIISLVNCLFAINIPDSPVWLLSHGKEKQALKSLCWLRGWCSEKNVSKEFHELVEHMEIKNHSILNIKTGCIQKNEPLMKRLKKKMICDIFVKETMRPMLFTSIYNIAFCFSGYLPTRLIVVNISNAIGMTITGETSLLIIGLLGVASNVLSAVFIKLIGKRNVALIAMLGTFACSFALAIYAKTYLQNVTSYDSSTFTAEKSVLPTVLFFMLCTFSSLSLTGVITSEVFPFKSRGVATGIAFAIGNICAFLSITSYLDIESNIQLYGAFFVNSAVSLFGFVYLYMFMPETEHKTLAEIEKHFSGDDLLIDNFVKRLIKEYIAPQRSSEKYEEKLLREKTALMNTFQQ